MEQREHGVVRGRAGAWRRRRALAAGVVLAGLLSAAVTTQPSAAQGGRAALRGTASAAGRPLAGAHIVLFAGSRTTPAELADATTASDGSFELSYEQPAGGVLYVELTTPASQALMLRSAVGVLGDAGGVAPQTVSSVTVNELTTVATSFALAQFSTEREIAGPSPGLENAAATVFNLVNPVDGTAGAVVTNEDNGASNDTLATLGTLANLVSLCAPGGGAGCDDFLRLATPPGAAAPQNTVQAVSNLARNPTLAPDQLFALAGTDGVVEPALTTAPAAWLLVLLYTEPELYASGRIAIDAKGNVWSSNNWLPGTQDPSPYVTVLSPVGQPILGSPIEGGGMKGGAWGAAITQDGSAWFGSFGGDAMSQYSADGSPVSPDAGWTDGDLSHPQGVAVDQQGNIWIANNYGPESPPDQGNVVVYPGGDPEKAITVTGGGLNHPFAIQIDGFGRAWVTNAGEGGANLVNTRADVLIGKFSGSVTVIGPDFEPTSFSPIEDPAFKWPLGLSIDSNNNAWVANYFGSTVTQIRPDGTVAADVELPKATLPWSEAVDGSDRVWVAGFARPAVWLLCGATTDACPPGTSTGTILSPPDGFASKAFQHFTSIQIDQSGNVWLSNNWSNLVPPVGGVGIAEIVGAATPVCTPLTPLPVKPSAESELACAEQFAPAVAFPSTDGSSGTPVWVWVALGVGVIVIAGGVVVLLRRHQRHIEGATPSST